MLTLRKLTASIFILVLALTIGYFFLNTHSGEPAIRPMNIIDPILAPIIDSFADEIDANTSNAKARIELGMTYEGASMNELAEATYKQFAIQFPDRVIGWYRLAVVQQKQGKIEEAIKSLLNAAELAGPKMDSPHWQLAFWYIELGDFDNASKQTELANSKKPNSMQVQIAKGRIALAQGKPELAIDILNNNQLIASIPDGYVYQLLGRAYRAAGDEEKSREAWSRAGQSKPNWADPWTALVIEHVVGLNAMRQEIIKQMRARNLLVARKLIDDYFTYDKDNRVVRRLDAKCNSLNGKSAKAMKKYLVLITEDQSDVVTMVLLAKLRMQLKKFQTEEEMAITKEILMEVIEISPDHGQAKILMESLPE
ncbi:MAG: tetratricopeptide repeat protein [Phycisphaerae bacterium]|nr:tetratricopeptide repeat protein [Phycisphaerae bacterium]